MERKEFLRIYGFAAFSKGVTLTANIPAGKYDMEAQLIDKDKRVYPALHVYIEKLK